MAKSYNHFNRIPCVDGLLQGVEIDQGVKNCIKYSGCSLCSAGTGCNDVTYCSCSTPLKENRTDFRLIRLSKTPDKEVARVVSDIQYVKSQSCNIRLISDVPVPKQVVFELAYSPYNVIQINIDLLLDSQFISDMLDTVTLASNCGLYTSVMLFPIIPELTPTYELLEMINRIHYNCKVVCFKFIEFDLSVCKDGRFELGPVSISDKYFENHNGKYVCSKYYKDSFCTIVSKFLESHRISCSLCNDKICY